MVYDAAIEAAIDERVEQVILVVDSNGGTVAGISEALEGIRELAKMKDVYTHTSSSMNSAAYWIGSAGKTVIADEMAEVGSIGVIAVVAEYTKQLEEEGVKAHVFRAGEFKALGGPYEELSDKAKEVIQDRIDARYDQFLSSVAENRGFTKDHVRKTMAEGQVFLAKDAESAGLVDSVMSFNDAFRLVIGERKQSNSSFITGGLESTSVEDDLPIHSQNLKGEEMSKKRVITKEVQAAVAEGVTLGTALGAVGTEVAESAEAPSSPEALEKAPAEVETAEVSPESDAPDLDNGVLALVEKVASLSLSLGEVKAELSSAKAEADLAEVYTKGLMKIASDSISRMSIALGAAVQDLSSLSPENLLALHSSTHTEFAKRLPVGQHVETKERDEAVDTAAEFFNQHLVTLVTKQSK